MYVLIIVFSIFYALAWILWICIKDPHHIFHYFSLYRLKGKTSSSFSFDKTFRWTMETPFDKSRFLINAIVLPKFIIFCFKPVLFFTPENPLVILCIIKLSKSNFYTLRSILSIYMINTKLILMEYKYNIYNIGCKKWFLNHPTFFHLHYLRIMICLSLSFPKLIIYLTIKSICIVLTCSV